MKTFEQYLTERFSWWDNLVVPWLLQPHKIPVFLAGAALGTVIGTGVGVLKGAATLNPMEVPRQATKWGLGMLTNWKYGEATQTAMFPPHLQELANELTKLAQLLQMSKSNPQEYQRYENELKQKSLTFMNLIKKMPENHKQQLASSLPTR